MFCTLFIAFALCLCSCGGPAPSPETPNSVRFSIKKPNFTGEWAGFEADGVDYYSLRLEGGIVGVFNLPVRIAYASGLPNALNIDEAEIYTFGVDPAAPVPLRNFVTEFYNSSIYPNGKSTFKYDKNGFLPLGKYSAVSITYDLETTPLFKASSVITISDLGKINYPFGEIDRGYNFKAHAEYVHKADVFNPYFNINIVVMGEAYTEDSLKFYRSYVRDAFQDHPHFHEIKPLPYPYPPQHEHISNDFFADYWNRINVIMLETICFFAPRFYFYYVL